MRSRSRVERTLGNGGGLEPKELGIRGEEIAARYLKEAGWTIRGRNVRVGRLELDLIISRGGILAFVEVKTRRGGGFGDPLEAISRKKMRDVARAAAGWLRENGRGPFKEIRFDAVSVSWPRTSTPRVLHIPDAWRMG
jgi:putative endonuclease